MRYRVWSLLVVAACSGGGSHAPVDARTAEDAQVDAAADAAPDAIAIDAAIIDAPAVDAPIDAAVIDAPVIDAPIDAAVIDAPVIDAPTDAPTDAPIDAPECLAGQSQTQECGACGSQSRACADGQWGAWGGCAGEGVCAPDSLETEACGSDIGTCAAGQRQRACTATCTWGTFGACGGGDYVGPHGETCDGGDDNCDGVTDEGCACGPMAPGTAGSLPVPGNVTRLVYDRVHCVVYALVGGVGVAAAELVVIDTHTRTQLARVGLGHPALGLDLASDASRLVVGHNTDELISVIVPPTWTVTAQVPTANAVREVEVTRAGLVYYVGVGSELRSIDLAAGLVSDRRELSAVASNADLELSPDEQHIYIARLLSSPARVRRFERDTDGIWQYTFDQTPSRMTSGQGGALSSLVLSADGRRLLFFGYQFEASGADARPDLGTTRGSTGVRNDGWSANGRWIVSGAGVHDAETLRLLSAFPGDSGYATTFALDDQEVWYHDRATGTLHWGHLDRFVSEPQRGLRRVAPLPLASYRFLTLVADPVRPLLYGVDPQRWEIVVMNRATLAPVAAFFANQQPTDLTIDPTGQTLYVGHEGTWGIGTIDLERMEWTRLSLARSPPARVEWLRADRLAVADTNINANTVFLIDPHTGAALASNYWPEPRLARGPGAWLYLSSRSTGCFAIYDTTGDALAQVAITPSANCEGGGSHIAPVPGSTDVFWSVARWSTPGLTSLFDTNDDIFAITPDARLGIGRRKIIDAATGAALAWLPFETDFQAIAPDGRTVYLGTDPLMPGPGVVAVDLTPYLP